jgi:hypothetical protein
VDHNEATKGHSDPTSGDFGGRWCRGKQQSLRVEPTRSVLRSTADEVSEDVTSLGCIERIDHSQTIDEIIEFVYQRSGRPFTCFDSTLSFKVDFLLSHVSITGGRSTTIAFHAKQHHVGFHVYESKAP